MRPVFLSVFGLFFGLGLTSATAQPSGPMAEFPHHLNRESAVTLVSSTSQAGLDAWIAGFKTRAMREGISQTTFDRAFRGVRYNEDVIAKDRKQSEFTKQIWDYLDSAASPTRVSNGQAAMRKHAAVLDGVERVYGVDKHVVAAIWGVESAYGATRGDTNVIEAMATLAYDGRRGRFFESQLLAALKILQSGDTSPHNMKGSWAGAMGHTQFIPTSFLAFAVDGNGDGKRDIWSNDPTDALASTAAYLAKHGWKKGQPWGVEVRLPAGFDYSSARRDTMRAPSDWASLGVMGIDGRPVPNYGKGSILLPAGASGAAFMIFDNFAVIERYNKADAYVIGVGHLSDRLRGGPAIQASWPRGYAPLSFKEKMQMQRILKRKGFLDDKVDGIIGPNTINAIRAFQNAVGVTPDGYPSQTLLKLLK
ncbi:MAG: lytic murein transglycosylase [Alphaproteobacteria bacterium]|uniref:Membrane-bound lytic murein transglycosylase B n=1 Tax=Celeribacter baekdonensis TaxID=875171 RepID=A0A1G7MRV6_9RHOB|nr:lytic murein transglycosylase [Celeribacter baekdonensis]MBU1278164.1 lytic murein transglycosylase [Alphaproteobacteria bacterium]MBU1574023.1 lytic murein transglycosylase [Alphaproteobacteria bacterium]MBU1829840.1 lytic murein transglycosylase [Alphaproteobacteria bacterium]MBU2077247.1 lytic murein transglycosylase [Alphaproteobacteria bacterium]MBU2160326.1 lytic murein transglycosylase [Alphaproteobacteria bacterium]